MSMFKSTMEREMERGVCYFLTWEGVAAIAAVAAVGISAYGMATQPGAPRTQTAPPPPNSTMYGEDGEILSRQVYDSAKNEWITYGPGSEPAKPSSYWATKLTGDYNKDILDPDIKRVLDAKVSTHLAIPGKHGNSVPQDEYDDMFASKDTVLAQYAAEAPEYQKQYDEWAADKATRTADKEKLAGIRSDTLQNLSQTPADRLAAYDEYAQKFSDSAHRTADPQFEKLTRGEEERANSTGMMGSRAYVDTKAELADLKTQQDTDISTQAAMAKESLAANDRNYWANLLNQIDSGQRADRITASQVNQTNSNMTNQNYAGTLGYYTAANNNALTDWEAKRQKSAAYTSAGTGMANGLLYLYGGMKSPAAAGGAAGSSSMTSGIMPTKTQAGTFSLFG